jgi:hypothetical protein
MKKAKDAPFELVLDAGALRTVAKSRRNVEPRQEPQEIG